MSERSKEERLAEIWRRLSDAPACRSHDEALQQLGEIIRDVEDEWTEIVWDPENWQTDGRMYPPLEDSARDVPERQDLVRYRNRGHNTFIRDNGAIEIYDTAGTVVFSKLGADGRGVELGE